MPRPKPARAEARVAQDPKDIVTPDAFTVAPELLGKPIAHPLRRLGAMLVDLVAVGLLSSLPGVVFGVAAAGLLTRQAFRKPEVAIPGRRWLLLSLAVVVLALFIGGSLASRNNGSAVKVSFGDEEVDVGAKQALGLMAEAIALETADTDAGRAAAARSFVDRVSRVEPDAERAREFADGVAKELDDPLARAALQDALANLPRKRVAAAPNPQLMRRYADLLATDPPAAEALRAEVAASVAAKDIAAARHDESAAEAEARALRAEVTELKRPRGLRGFMEGLADDLGLGFGWAVLYFTAFTAWWRGQTPGKRLFGCRVVGLDGKPLTAWGAFSRAGGYAASLATGLLGFAEILWDPNRQALHDRISRTVVLRDREKA